MDDLSERLAAVVEDLLTAGGFEDDVIACHGDICVDRQVPGSRFLEKRLNGVLLFVSEDCHDEDLQGKTQRIGSLRESGKVLAEVRLEDWCTTWFLIGDDAEKALSEIGEISECLRKATA